MKIFPFIQSPNKRGNVNLIKEPESALALCIHNLFSANPEIQGLESYANKTVLSYSSQVEVSGII